MGVTIFVLSEVIRKRAKKTRASMKGSPHPHPIANEHSGREKTDIKRAIKKTKRKRSPEAKSSSNEEKSNDKQPGCGETVLQQPCFQAEVGGEVDSPGLAAMGMKALPSVTLLDYDTYFEEIGGGITTVLDGPVGGEVAPSPTAAENTGEDLLDLPSRHIVNKDEKGESEQSEESELMSGGADISDPEKDSDGENFLIEPSFDVENTPAIPESTSASNESRREPDSEKDDGEKANKLKLAWTVGSKLEVFSQSTGEWYEGSILSIDNDEEGEWLCVSYGENPAKQKQIQRFSANLKPAIEEQIKVSDDEEAEDLSAANEHSEMTEEEAEDKVRMRWKIGSKLEVFSQSTGEWSDGKILTIDVDDEGEWLTVSYGPEFGKQKQIQRWNANIKPNEADIEALLTQKTPNKVEKSDASETEPKPVQNENSKQEILDKVRKSWKNGSSMEVFSQSTSQWYKATILSIDNDSEGEWLTVSYDNQKQKQIQRYNKNIRPLEADILKMEQVLSGKTEARLKIGSAKTPTSDPALMKKGWNILGNSHLYQSSPSFNDRVLLRITGNLRRKEMLQSSRAEILRLQISALEVSLKQEQDKLDELKHQLDQRPKSGRRDSITQCSPLSETEKENDEYMQSIRSRLRRFSDGDGIKLAANSEET